jgi:membrane protease YdiL (CAAX protease family)
METIMTPIDHIFALIVVVIHPIAGYFSYQRLLRRIEAGEKIARATIYGSTMLGHWALFAMAIAIWYWAGRPADVLGFDLQLDAAFLIGTVLTLVIIGFFLHQVRQVVNAGDDEIRKFRAQLGNLEVLLPANGNELGRFYGLSLTAGIVEETIWRGFLLWYLIQFMPVWAAAAISAIGFGLAHAYQGAANIPKVTLIGAVFVGLYLLTGSLWPAMILHAALDILQGRAAYEVVHRTATGPTATDSAPAVGT